jgi:thiosulfate/3-mercaptopyruvate sulfurtransferase
VTADELALRLGERSVALLDVRSLAEYTGEAGYPCDPRQGHISGAVQLEWTDLFAGDGRPLDREAILALLRERGVGSGKDIVCYCHSGNRSQMAVVALRAAGFERVENYDGSWHEWSRREDG